MFVFAALLIGAFAYADTASTSTPATAKSDTMKSTMTKMEPVEGSIVSVDSAKHSLTVTVNGENKTYQLSSKTQYMVNGKKSKSADLKAGANVAITADSKNVAHVIEVKQ
jgi:hypothetical protein